VTKRNSGSELQVSATPSPEEVRAQVDKILASRHFSRSERLCRFLRFCVEQTLAEKSDQLKEQLVGVEVFDRRGDYDPRTDPIVRVEAMRLRSKLKAYYTSIGRPDCVFIELPKGAYVPVFRSRSAGAPTRPQALPSHGTEERSIAVLPFTNLTPETSADYFSDGLTEELIHLLTRIPRLRVVAWSSMSQLRGREQDLAGIRQQLRVATVLRGSIRRTEDRVRVTAQLIDAESGAYLWSEAYDRQLENVLAIQEEMARAIVNTLQLSLAPRDVKLSQPAVNLECHNLCLQGRFHANKRTPEGLRQSTLCFEQAVAADERSADAHAGLADAYSLLADYGLADPGEVIPKAKAAAEKALRLDPQSSEAHASLAFIRSTYDWDWAGADLLYRRAIALNPGYLRAHHWYGTDYLSIMGRFEEAKREARLARHLDPLSPIILEGDCYVHLLSRELTRALELYVELAQLDPLFYKAYSGMGRVLNLMGHHDEALAKLERARELAGDVPTVLAATGQVLAAAGFVWEARAVLDQLHAIHRDQWVPSVCLAIVHLGLGDHKTALTHLETACDKRERGVNVLKVHPLYDPLRAEPRFQRMLERVGFLP
jgi:TolB-like protein/cytochrome c-type biogenesis protein CcmH/NrfG